MHHAFRQPSSERAAILLLVERDCGCLVCGALRQAEAELEVAYARERAARQAQGHIGREGALMLRDWHSISEAVDEEKRQAWGAIRRAKMRLEEKWALAVAWHREKGTR